MDIDGFIKKEAPEDTPHDKAYGEALRDCFKTYENMAYSELLEWQKIARKRYDSTHHMVAACMILQELINEMV